MKDKPKYFNFPVPLLSNFLTNKKECLDNILYYSLYYHAENKLEHGSIDQRIKASADHYNVQLGSAANAILNGKELNEVYNDQNLPIIGLSLNIYWDYRSNYKTEFEDVTLLAFLAIKSIVQKKSYNKLTNLFWLSRMNGNPGTVESAKELSNELQRYAKEYQITKIKDELSINWNLIHYGRYTRGFYVSFKMTLENLIFQVEKKRKSKQVQTEKEKRKIALSKAMERLK